jgi:signal transduction histidine kinase/CheY-like chemotaxis protein
MVSSLLAVVGGDLVIAAATADTQEFLSVPHDHLLGAHISLAIGTAGEKQLRELVRTGAFDEPVVLDGRLDAVVRRRDGMLVLELEPARRDLALDARVLRAALELQQVERAPELARLAAREVRALTGFDRATVYRYYADAVEAIADERREDLPPAPARPAAYFELTAGEPPRFVADAGAPPRAVASTPLLPAGQDLAPAVRRDGHAGAALALPIDVAGARWGVIACEHAGPLAVPLRARAAAAAVTRLFAGQLRLRERFADELREASMAKDEFLATVSHELRTPLNAMLGWLRLIEAGQVAPERYGHAIATVTRNAHALGALVEELLDVSRIISGKMRLELQPLAPASVLDTVLATVQPAAEAKAIRIATTIDPAAGPVLADAGRLQQVIWNLMTNALKFTPEGGHVDIRLERTGAHVQLAIADTGSGIDADLLPQVFDRFFQAPGASDGARRGLGLGLAIARHLVELHGGTVAVTSAGAGCGATFFVRLPIAAPRAQVAAPAPAPQLHGHAFEPAPQLHGLRVLAVDDERDSTEVLRAVLAASGVEVTTARTGHEALALLPAVRPDVLISDIGMPDLDGYELIQRVRRLPPEHGARVPAIAVTALARSQDRARAFLAGFDVYIAKPIDPAELTAVLVNLTGRRTGPIAQLATLDEGPRGALAGARLLVVDDDVDSGELLAEILRMHGAETEIAHSAAAAAAAVCVFRPDVLLSDISLPDKDGYTFIRELRARGADDGGWIPAIAISGHVAPDDVKRAILAGFQLHLAKPLDPNDLVARLARLVGRAPRRT